MTARIAATVVAGLMCGVGMAGWAAASEAALDQAGRTATLRELGAAGRESCRRAIDRLPVERMPPESRRLVEHFRKSTTLHRRLPAETLECDRALVEFVLDKPEALVDVWRVLGISRVSLDPAGPAAWRLSDGYGTTGTVRLLHHERSDAGDMLILHSIWTDLAEAAKSGTVGVLIPIRKGRTLLEKEIFDTAKPKLAEFGIDLLDIRFKRINYNEEVQVRIYERMVSERQQIAERFRSEGAGEAAKILGDKEKELRRIESEAYKIVETTRGEADAKASQIYADAFNRSPEAAEFYEFMRTLELYQKTMHDTTAVFTTDSDLFKYLKAVKPLAPSKSVEAPAAVPAPAPTAPALSPAPSLE